MKIRNILTSAIIFAGVSALIMGCETGTVGDNAPEVSVNPITEKYKFEGGGKYYEISYSNPWRVTDSEDGYDVTFIPTEDINAAPFKFSVRRDDVTDETDDISKARSFYSSSFGTGIVEAKEFKIADLTGLWLTNSSAQDMGLEIEGITQQAQESSSSFELGIVISGKSVYIFKYEPTSSEIDEETNNQYRSSALSLLEGMKFKKKD